jgi:hypothetical protein
MPRLLETVDGGQRDPVSFLTKMNPVWWLGGPNGLVAPAINNGTPYLPDVHNEFLRSFYWFWRNPFMNFVGFVLGVEDRHYMATGPAPVMLTTWADAVPPSVGWKWAVLSAPWSPLWFLNGVVNAIAMYFVSWWFLLPLIFALIRALGYLPYISYAGRIVFYLGWRPYSGGFGLKFVVPRS